MSDVVEKITEMLNEDNGYQSKLAEIKKLKTTEKQAKLLYNFIANKEISEKDLVFMLGSLYDQAISRFREERTS